MIKTPVYYSDKSSDMNDAHGRFIAHVPQIYKAYEIVKRINLHDKLVEALKSSTYALKQQYGNDSDFVNKIDELLEECK